MINFQRSWALSYVPDVPGSSPRRDICLFNVGFIYIFSKSFFSKVFLQDFFCFVTRVPRSLIYLQNFDNNMLAHNLFYDLATSHL